MGFLRRIALVCLLFSSFCLCADSPFHAMVASGYAWSMRANIRDVDEAYWAPSDTGYNAKLGNSPFIMLGFGYRFFQMLDSDFEYTLYDSFEYQKNQTDPFGNKRTRFFTLNHQSSIFNFTLFPYRFSLSKMDVVPFAAIGIGVGTNKVSDFETVFYDPISGGTGLITSIGQSRTTNAFAWQGMGGFRFGSKESFLSLDLAYRYCNGGTFKTPSSVTDYNGVGQGGVDSVPCWKGTLQTNQLYYSANVSI